jgi:hypothetical protein
MSHDIPDSFWEELKSIVKAPLGGEKTGKNPTDRRKLG